MKQDCLCNIRWQDMADRPDHAPTFNDIVFPELAHRRSRYVYIITYSRCNAEYTKERFAEIIVNAFTAIGSTITQWVCSKERHHNGAFHFHMTIKLGEQKRWRVVKASIETEYPNIRLHFSECDDETKSYDGAYRYTVKGGDFTVSVGHPDMGVDEDIPKFDKLKFKDFILQTGVTSIDEVMAIAKENADHQQNALYNFIISTGKSRVQEVMDTTWEIEAAPAKVARMNKSCIEILKESSETKCSCSRANEWEYLALQTVANNNIPLDSYTQAVLAALTLGRGKFRNIMHIGETNCAKTFLLQPLKKMFTAFENPARSTFNWVGVEECEVIILNDFRWSPSVIAWEQLLQLLEGDTTNFPAPKN